ncbi:hypothetical protein EX895_000759 [Sporisorium graminicola]|uniref:CUE domain-containing protein n=1 Tax=Sporisorium graminicola TaxID=280036 RepID=A0A4U7L0L6_9BASI|nr:hypothetical protein EX895_000759 [Sporisorium graminicola]TKY90761.1 hypothetical protein EX895_000759 [Sporisorium graminicola]
MSEPVQKGEIDLKSLDQALNDGEAASEVPAETLQRNSDTLAQPPADDRSLVGKAAASTENAQKASSPTTLSPSSPRALSPAPAADQTTVSAAVATEVPPAVAELKIMFPDLDNETIGAVLSSRGGDQEAAVNALLQMSDPNFKPTTTERGTDSDALLAQSIAMEEEHRHHERLARRQQQQQQYGSGRGGGGAGSFFSGLLNPDVREPSAAAAPSYDPNALAYQPRVRRSAPASTGARTSYAPPNHPPPGASRSYEAGDSVIPGMPGAKEAKQWQEEINRMAESGLARATSTFSSFRQKASAAFNNPQDGSGQPGAVGSSGGNGANAGAAGAGFAQAFQNFRNSTGRGSNPTEAQQATTPAATATSRQFTSPRSPHASEYDQDPSPVSENELAKIISRGGGGSAGSSSPSTAGKARALAERYGLGINNANRTGSGSAASGGAADYAGWEQAGRTPIVITDNTANVGAGEGKDSVALMDAAGGRGVTSPRVARSPARQPSPVKAAGAAGVAAAVGAGAGVGVGAVALDTHEGHDLNDDSDDLEYVSNPFEDED